MALILAHNRAQSVNQRAAVPKTLTNFVLSSVCSRDTERASLPNTGPPAETGRSPCKLHASFSLSHAISCRIVSHHKLVSQLMSLAQPPASELIKQSSCIIRVIKRHPPALQTRAKRYIHQCKSYNSKLYPCTTAKKFPNIESIFAPSLGVLEVALVMEATHPSWRWQWTRTSSCSWL